MLSLVGEEGLAELLRSMVKDLDLDQDKIVPPEGVLKARALQQQAAVQRAREQLLGQAAPAGGKKVTFERGSDGAIQGAKVMPDLNEQLLNNAPVTDVFTQPRNT